MTRRRSELLGRQLSEELPPNVESVVTFRLEAQYEINWWKQLFGVNSGIRLSVKQDASAKLPRSF